MMEFVLSHLRFKQLLSRIAFCSLAWVLYFEQHVSSLSGGVIH